MMSTVSSEFQRGGRTHISGVERLVAQRYTALITGLSLASIGDLCFGQRHCKLCIHHNPGPPCSTPPTTTSPKITSATARRRATTNLTASGNVFPVLSRRTQNSVSETLHSEGMRLATTYVDHTGPCCVQGKYQRRALKVPCGKQAGDKVEGELQDTR